jgi:hypothetical protein
LRIKKLLWPALVTGFGLLAAGCSGINASGTASPASFFLPGIMKADPPPAGRLPQTIPDPVVLVALAR